MKKTGKQPAKYPESGVHRGRLLELVVKRLDPPRKDLAEALGVDPASLYRIYSNPNMKLKYFRLAGEFLKYDFSDDVPELQMLMAAEPTSPYRYAKMINLEECERRISVAKNETEQYKTLVINLQKDLLEMQKKRAAR